ncbi:GntR family transcriptional regulator [Bacillus subtilis]|uniref:GntR family transcriptional regulator n=1 Tax=Pseudochrobactrum asaccharolyticum TaxID=354351 RepID=UPI001F02B6DF|nr:GntR family transcriptional regulator [Pseudochrobactrum asaccharolyticum]MCF7647454.1 GntR family transcriptional regulator [Pseudochrobactrum asaccharolyticum]MCF7673634.1 GntR family transcriptional regulator [Bacillus subtilis]
MQKDEPSKVNAAYLALKNDILKLYVAPNFPLKIKWLQETYGFGATPLREALSRLEGDHLVKLVPNKGYFTSPASYEEFVELYTNRNRFKQHLLAESILYGDADWEANIVATHYRLTCEVSPAIEICSPEEYNCWVQAHDAFDQALMSAHRSPWMYRFNVQLTEHIRRQARAFLMIMPETAPQDFSVAATQSPALRALYAIEIYTELKDAVLSRNFEKIKTLSDIYTSLVLNSYKEINDKL